MQCPKCSGEMEVTTYDEIRVDRCKDCKGLWFQADELAELRRDQWMADYILDEGEARVGRGFNRVSDVNCPECGTPMRRERDSEQKHIVYEACPAGHGAFLDAGEFTDLVHRNFWDRFKRAN